MFTPNEIRRIAFTKTAVGGYKQTDVDEFLEEVADLLEGLQREKDSLVKKLGVLADKIEEYREEEDSIRTALVSAQQLGDKIVRESKAESETTLLEAKAEAEAALSKARVEAEKLTAEAKASAEQEITAAKAAAEKTVAAANAEADRIIGQVKKDAVEQEKYLESLKKEVTLFKSNLLAIYKSHIEMINQLPETELEPQEKSEAPAPQAEAKPELEEAPAAEAPQNREAAPIAEPVKVTESKQYVAIQTEPAPQEEPQPDAIPVLDEQIRFDGMFSKKPEDVISYEAEEEKSEAPAYQRSYFQGGFKNNLNSEKPPIKFGEDYSIEDDEEEETQTGFFKRRKK